MGACLWESAALFMKRLLWALTLGVLVLYVASAALALLVPELLETGEPALVTAAFRAAEGESLYGSVEQPPFLHHNYTPLGSWLQAPLIACTGPDFLPGRLVALVAVVLVLALVWRALRSDGVPRWAAIGGAATFVSGGVAFPWLFVGRVDMPALALSFAAFFVVTSSTLNRWRMVLFLALALAAWMTKQTAASGAVAGLLVLLLRGRVSLAVVLGLAWLALVSMVILWLNAATSGGFWRHAVTFNAGHSRDGFGADSIGFSDVLVAVGPVLLGLGGIGLGVLRAAVLQRWGVYLLVALCMGVVGLSKSGSHVHHLLETCAVLAVLAGHGWMALERTLEKRPLVVLCTVSVLLVLGVWSVREGAWQKLKHLHWLATRESPVPSAVLDTLGESEAAVLCLGKSSSLAIESHREAWLDIADWRRLEQMGEVRAETALLPLIRAGHFALIAVPEYPLGHPAEPLFNPLRVAGFQSALEASYELMRDVGGNPLRMDDPKSRHSATFWRRKA